MRRSILIVALASSACGIPGQIAGSRGGAQARVVADHMSARIASSGPVAGAAGTSSRDGPSGTVFAGWWISALLEEGSSVRAPVGGGWGSVFDSELAFALGLDGGWDFADRAAFGSGYLGFGWKVVTLGLDATGSFDTDSFGFGLGPELVLHLRLGDGTGQSELQVFGGARFYVLDRPRFSDRAQVGLRFLWDVYD